MNINRNNYEEFFLLYVDNELGAAERKAVEDFVSQNPDLNGEWETYLQTKLSPDSSISFSGKHLLFRDASFPGSEFKIEIRIGLDEKGETGSGR